MHALHGGAKMKTYESLGLPGIDDESYWESVARRAAELASDG